MNLIKVDLPESTKSKKNLDLHTLRTQRMKDGMTPLRIAGTYKILEGLTSCEDALKLMSLSTYSDSHTS